MTLYLHFAYLKIKHNKLIISNLKVNINKPLNYKYNFAKF